MVRRGQRAVDVDGTASPWVDDDDDDVIIVRASRRAVHTATTPRHAAATHARVNPRNVTRRGRRVARDMARVVE